MPGEGLTHGPPATKKAGGSHHRFSRIIRHSPRNGFNGVLRALPGDRAFLPPSSARSSSRQLGISVGMPGPHDFAVRYKLVRLTSHSVHRLPASRVVTIAIRPLHRGGMPGHNHMFLENGREIFFASWLDGRIKRCIALRTFVFRAREFAASAAGKRNVVPTGLSLSGESALAVVFDRANILHPRRGPCSRDRTLMVESAPATRLDNQALSARRRAYGAAGHRIHLA